MDTTTKLEIAKIIAQLITPGVVGYLGWKVSKRLKDIEQHQWGNRKLTEKRIQIYDEISPLLNRLFCYFTYVGDWQKHTPADIIETKRSLDHKIFVNRYLLEVDVFKAYQAFIHALFEHFNGIGEDAKLKTGYRDRRASPSFTWDEDWNRRFINVGIASERLVLELYEQVMKAQRKGINA